MSRAKMLVATLVSVIAPFAVAASTASAAEWFVGGTKLATTVAVATTAQLDSLVVLQAPTLTLSVHCLGPQLLIREVLQAPDKVLVNEIIDHNCLALSPANCTVGPLIVFPGPLEGLVLSNGVTHWRPRTGKLVAVLDWEGEKCAIAGEKPLNGEFALSYGSIGTEEAIHAVEGLGTTENNSLETGGNKVYIYGGHALVGLASGLRWSFH